MLGLVNNTFWSDGGSISFLEVAMFGSGEFNKKYQWALCGILYMSALETHINRIKKCQCCNLGTNETNPHVVLRI